MWPLFVLFNKFLKVEEENNEAPAQGHLNLVESYPFEHLLSKEKWDSENLSQSVSFEVPHINQQHTWDCGLACVFMVLRTLGIHSGDIHDLEELCRTTSIWTVDLAYLLQNFSVKFCYFTVTLGANPNFSVETFYKDQLPNDLLRVDMLFQKARDAGIYGDSPGYTGHYVIICGYDTSTDEFEIRDPASSRKHEKITSRRLQEARKAFGTDEDLLLISLEKRENQSSPLLSLFPQ